MNKTAIASLCIMTAAFAAQADTTLWEDDFSTYTGSLLYQGPWSAMSSFTNVPNNSARGSNEVLIAGNYARMVLAAKEDGVNVANLQPGEAVRITLDHRFVALTNAGNYADFEIVMTDTNQNWFEGWRTDEGWPAAEPTIGMKIEYNNFAEGTKKYWPNKANSTNNATAILAVAPTYCGFQPNLNDATSDVVRITYTITKSETTNEFEVAGVFSNLTSGATLSLLTVPNIVATNAWNDDDMCVMIKSTTPFGKCEDYLDYIKVEKLDKPRDVIVFADNFNDIIPPAKQFINARTGWQLNNNNSAWVVTNGVAIQRPNLSSTLNEFGYGYRGAISTVPMHAEPGDTLVVEFDWNLFTDGAVNNDYLDIGMATQIWTNGVWTERPSIYYSSTNSAMSFRLRQTATGLLLPKFAEHTDSVDQAAINLSVFGLDPVNLDNEGDTMHVIYTLEKTTNVNVWVVGLSFSNRTTGATAEVADIGVTNAAWYNQENFYFMSISSDALLSGKEGSQFDNFMGIQRGPAPPAAPKGWEKFLADYPALSGNPLADYDSDGVSDVAEYGLGGNPTDSGDRGNQPVFTYGADNNARFSHYELTSADRGITYTVEKATDLVIGDWADAGWNDVTTNTVDDTFAEVKHQFWGADADKSFVRLIIDTE